jgi:GT2 family glycosyltransferase
MFSIIIPTYNNLSYLQLCLRSIKLNSYSKHEIIVHVNDGSDGTLDFVKKKKIKHTYSKNNIGLCTGVNRAARTSKCDYILYTHDDMYFCPNWDKYLADEVKGIKHNKFYISGTMIEAFTGHITYNCGETIEKFNEKKLLNNYKKLKYHDHQGTHFAPHLIEKKMWKKIGGFSEEFNPGYSSDPDLNMKLWKKGVRIFKGLNKFRVYHFSSITTRKNKNLIKNKGNITFLLKWGFTIKFFKKHYLKSKTKYTKPLNEPKKDIFYFSELFFCKIKLIYTKIFK